MENLKIEIKNKILEYIEPDVRLTPLDITDKNYYTGVTLDYICQYVLEEKYSTSIVAECLKELHLEDSIHSLRCNEVGNIVFENNDSDHWNYGAGSYQPDIKYLHEYLDEIINNK